jgi:thioredoxin 2
MAVDSQDLNTLANQQALPVIIDFWAPWCGPCRQFAPAFAAAAQQYGGRLIFAKLDTEANESAAVSYQIRSIPTLIVLRNGREVQRVSGALPASQLDKFIQEVL